MNPIHVVTVPPGVRYPRLIWGSRRRSTMCDRFIIAYDTQAPNTAMSMSASPLRTTTTSTKPTAPMTMSASAGVLRLPVTASRSGKYPARDRANIWREPA